MEGTPEENLYNYCPKCGARLIVNRSPPTRGKITEVENDENLDMLLKDWDIDKINKPDDLSMEDDL